MNLMNMTGLTEDIKNVVKPSKAIAMGWATGPIYPSHSLGKFKGDPLKLDVIH